MKKISKMVYVLIGIGFLATGCSEDEIMKTTPATPGDAIVFGATASIENGNPLSRTVYGDKDKDNGFQVINWKEGDIIRIACAQAAQDKVADYIVQDITEGSTSGDRESSATTLNKQGNGLQWGTGEHTFYAVYPSPAHFNVTDVNQQPHTVLEGDKVSGVLASVQKPKTYPGFNADGQYVMEPDMDQAYMAARAHYDAAKEGGEGVTLHFKPLVTAIEVEIKAGEINLNATTSNNTLTLTNLRLRSASGKNLAGKFSADISGLNDDAEVISGVKVRDVTPGDISTSSVSVSLPSDGIELTKDQSVVVTFFILPTATFENGNNDLKLDVGFMFAGANGTKTCTLGREVKAHCKYYFSNITLPAMSSTISSNWVSLLDNNILISQLSIPGAGNAASESGNVYREQVKTLTELWNMGVRCFELVSDYDEDGLANSKIWCGGAELNVSFDAAMEELSDLLKANPTEFLIIICNYQPYKNGRSPANYMTSFTKSYGSKYTNVVALKPESTVGDLRSKIAFIGRITSEGEDNPLTLDNVPEWFVHIAGWGSLKDKWNRRYGSSYNPAYNSSYNGSTMNLEDRLWQTGSNSTSPSWTPDLSGYPAADVDFSYTTSVGENAWVQEWMRVVPEGGILKQLSRWNRTYLFINWPASYEEKKGHVIATFEKAKNQQDKLYINSLCGYYVADGNDNSYTPYLNSSSVRVNGYTYSVSQGTSGGLGGDFASYNGKIMEDVYDYLYGQVSGNTTGPMGIVMMDYIGNTVNSTLLPALIYENNFKFPLKTGDSSSATQYDASYVKGGDAIGWE